MNPASVVAVLLVLALLIPSARWLWQARPADSAARPRTWRVLALIVLQSASAAALYRCLFPPPRQSGLPTLVVLTEGAGTAKRLNAASNERVVALPESNASADIARSPDLATALRQHPGTTRLRVLGHGLMARDRELPTNLALVFEPAPLPAGFIELQRPRQANAGAKWRLSGRVHGVAHGSVELRDPADRQVSRVTLDKGGRFAIEAAARSPGRAEFSLRLRDALGKTVEKFKLPVLTVAAGTTRLRVVAGAPSPELKYLRRWASDAGLRMDSEISVSPGMRVADSARFDAATLAETDLLVLDDRAWSNLGEARRALLLDAIRQGLGVLLRITAPVSERDRRSLHELGFDVAESHESQAVKLAGGAAADAPELTRRPLRVNAEDAAVLLRDDRGRPLSLWRAEGRGRVALWWLSDSFKLVLAGQRQTHATLWSEATGTLARARGPADEANLTNIDARVQQRIVWCSLGTDPQVTAPSGTRTRLLVTIAAETRCAAYWPAESGWHVLEQQGKSTPFAILAEKDAPGVAANERLQATARLTTRARPVTTVAATTEPGSPWPWFFAWLLFTTALWAMERARWGLSSSTGQPARPVE